MGMGGQGNSAFDLAYFVLQIACAVAWVLAIRRRAAWVALGAAALSGVVLPLVWDVGWPPTSGIEGAGRIVLGAPPSLVNAVAGALVAARSMRRAGAPLATAAARVAAVPLASAALWVWLLFN